MADPVDGPSAETPREVFARQLQEFRKRAGLTQEALAERVREVGGTLHSTAITRIEKNKRDVSLDESMQLAMALNVPPDMLTVPAEGWPGYVRLSPEAEARQVEHYRQWVRGTHYPRDAEPIARDFAPRGLVSAIASNVQTIATDLEYLTEKVEDLERRLSEVEQRPSEDTE